MTKYLCDEIFMVRTPMLPYNLLIDYYGQKEDIATFIKKNDQLENYFKTSLYLSSNSLYREYISPSKKAKKISQVNNSLLKFFSRATTRPTPYGMFAEVSLGVFSSTTDFEKGNTHFNIDIDNQWLSEVISVLEKNKEVRENLLFIFNNSTYASGDRLKNPSYSNINNSTKGVSIFEGNSIRNTDLMKHIKEEASDFISFSDLVEKIRKIYPNISIDVIRNTLNLLITNEFLYSNLRIPAFCDNKLEYLIQQLKTIDFPGTNIDLVKNLQNIQKILSQDFNQNVLFTLVELMESINKSSNYLICNCGNDFKENKLDYKIKRKIERFVDFLTYIPVNFDELGSFKKEFIGHYGVSVEVPLIEIIDKNDFDGLKYLSETDMEEKNSSFISCLNGKISEAIINGEEEVKMTLNDAKKDRLPETKNWVDSFDLNVFLTKKGEEIIVSIGPNMGSNIAGSMFQRFSKCFNQNQWNKYKRKLIESSSETLKVECRECPTFARNANVINNEQLFDYYFCMGTHGANETPIIMEDILIGIDRNERLYAKSKSLDRELDFVSNNMLNPSNYNKVIQLLLSISRSTQTSPLNILKYLNFDNYLYTPRILFDGVIISLKKWHLTEAELESSCISDFMMKISQNRRRFNIDSVVYCISADNRLIINLNDISSLKMLYGEYKKRKSLDLSEIEPGLLEENDIVTKNKKSYINELIFSVQRKPELFKSNDSLIHSHEIKSAHVREDFLLCDRGWIYFKLYGVGERANEIICTLLPQLLSKLGECSHFFIRYRDLKGDHLRIRLKFPSEEKAYLELSIINNWIKSLIKTKTIADCEFGIYRREINRYGGKHLITTCEDFFFHDSLWVEEILVSNVLEDENEIKDAYIFGIVFILSCCSQNIDEMFDTIDYRKNLESYRNEYKNDSKYLDQYIDSIINISRDRKSKLSSIESDLRNSLHKIKSEINKASESKTLTNDKASIVLALIHMHCNRLTGDLMKEEKYIGIVRHYLYKTIQVQKYYSLQDSK